MATVFERVINTLELGPDAAPDEQYINIHAFDASLNFVDVEVVGYGDWVYSDIAQAYNLNAQQQTELRYLHDLIEAAKAVNARNAFQRANKDYWYQGEAKVAPQWEDEDAYWDTLRRIIQNAGGSPPVKPF